jgi:hypothetical protein
VYTATAFHEADAEAGRLVPVIDVERAVFDMCRIARDQLLGIPSRVSAQLSGLTDLGEIERTLDLEIRSALDELSSGRIDLVPVRKPHKPRSGVRAARKVKVTAPSPPVRPRV